MHLPLFSVHYKIWNMHIRFWRVWHSIAWRSKHQNVIPTDISRLLVVGTSVFLVPLTLQWKGRWYRPAMLAEWSCTTKSVAYFHMALHLVMLILWRCPWCRPHGCSLLGPKKCKPQCVMACPQFIATNSNITIWLYTNYSGSSLVATFGSSFREPLWRIALGSHFGVWVWRIAALGQ